MADGMYERRGPREAELRHFQRLIDEQRNKATPPKPDHEKMRGTVREAEEHSAIDERMNGMALDQLRSARVVS